MGNIYAYVRVPTNDWNSKENVGMWRKDLVDTINSVNEQIGNTENFWNIGHSKSGDLT